MSDDETTVEIDRLTLAILVDYATETMRNSGVTVDSVDDAADEAQAALEGEQ